MTEISSQLRKARNFLFSNFPNAFTADAIKDKAGLTISISTLGPKLRLYARRGELDRDYFMGCNGQRQVRFSCNAEYLAQTAAERRVEQAENAREAAHESAGVDSLSKGATE